MSQSTPTPQVQPQETLTDRRSLTIGLPACQSPSERRFPLTPGAAAELIERGFRIRMESGAPAAINYTDNQYMRAGVNVGTREEALACDIVIHLAPPDAADVRKMRRGAMLLTLLKPRYQKAEAIRELLSI